MRLGVLFSGGKDSCVATFIAQEHADVVCLLAIESENEDSYMFHTPNIRLVDVQAQAMNIPLLKKTTKGVKEEELKDLKSLIIQAKEQYNIEGVVTGALASVYQATRVEKICYDLGLYCFHPLWQKDEEEHVRNLLEWGFSAHIISVAAYPLDESFLGRIIDEKLLDELLLMNRFSIHVAGEGGEYESFVTYGPLWEQEIHIKGKAEFVDGAGRYKITKAELYPIKKKELTLNIHQYDIKESDVLLVDCNNETLGFYSYVLPIKKIVEKEGLTTSICHIKDFKEELTNTFSQIIICGTPIQDNNFLEYEISFLSDKKKVLGICAGAQLLAKQLGFTVEKNPTIGMQRLEEETPLGFVKEAYFVQQNKIITEDKAVTVLQDNNWFLCSFHPEVRNEDLIKSFLKK